MQNKYKAISTNETFYNPTLGVGVLLASQLMFTDVSTPLLQDKIETIELEKYTADMFSPTYQDLSPSYNQHNEMNNLEFARKTGVFYADLTNRQESLGKEFDKVLYNNLWELYER